MSDETPPRFHQTSLRGPKSYVDWLTYYSQCRGQICNLTNATSPRSALSGRTRGWGQPKVRFPPSVEEGHGAVIHAQNAEMHYGKYRSNHPYWVTQASSPSLASAEATLLNLLHHALYFCPGGYVWLPSLPTAADSVLSHGH